MSSTTNTLATLNELINASVKNTEERIAAQAFVIEAAKKAKATEKLLLDQSKIAEEASNKLVSDIQTTLANQRKEVEKEVKATYHNELVRLGVKNPDNYPFTVAVSAIDTVASTGFGLFGKALKGASNVFNYAKEKTAAGFKS